MTENELSVIPDDDLFTEFTRREIFQIYNAILYKQQFTLAGVPTHSYLLLIAKLAKLAGFELPLLDIQGVHPGNIVVTNKGA